MQFYPVRNFITRNNIVLHRMPYGKKAKISNGLYYAWTEIIERIIL